MRVCAWEEGGRLSEREECVRELQHDIMTDTKNLVKIFHIRSWTASKRI